MAIDYAKRHTKNPDIIDFILEHSREYEYDDLDALLAEKFPGHDLDMGTIERMSLHESSAKPEDIIDVIPYIVSMHGKFYNMTEIPGRPGCYEDKAIDYETPMKYLRENGFDGYIDSEFEGQRDQQDIGYENLVDEVDQVRKHHEMLKRLSEGE